jgi:hypothetical protein
VTSPLRVLKEVRPDFGKALKGPEKLKFFQGNFALVVDSKASLNLKGPFGVTNLKVCSQKIVPIFFFFCLCRVVLSMDKPLTGFKRGTTRLWGRKKLQFFSG